MEQDIEKLLEKYYGGETSIEEEKELKRFFTQEMVPENLQSHAAQFGYFVEMGKETPSLAFDHALMLKLDPPPQGKVRRLGTWLLQIAAGLALLIVGFTSGWVFQKKSDTALSQKTGTPTPVVEMKAVLAFDKMNETSASERIQAVNQSYGLSNVDRDITQLLINTLNFDPNINVRLAACQALMHFESEPGVSEALVQSLAIQTDPNVQISLIETLVSIREKRAMDQFQQLLKNEQVLQVVREQAKAGLSELQKAEV